MQLVGRIAQLLDENARCRIRPFPVQQQLGARHSVQRKICRRDGEVELRNGAARRQRRDHAVPQLPRSSEFFVRTGKDLLVEKALPRQRAAEARYLFVPSDAGEVSVEAALFRGGRVVGGAYHLEHCEADGGQQPLQLDIADGRRFHEAAQKAMACDRAQGSSIQQLMRGQTARPGLHGPRDGDPDRTVLLDDGGDDRSQIIGAPPWFLQRTEQQRTEIFVGREGCQRSHALNEERLGLRRLGDGQGAPQDPQRIARLPHG